MTAFEKMLLEEKLSAICDEIRNYPTPIARCDEQLAALLEQRAVLLRTLSNSSDMPGSCSPLAAWTNDGGFDAA